MSHTESSGEIFLKDARIVRQPGDNCCLFHSLSYCLWDEGVVNYVHDEFSGFELRANIFSFLRDNGDVNVSLAPGVVTTISRALQLDGSSCEAYYQKMLNIAELGGPFEIAILAQMFSIGISIYECVPNTRYFRHLGSYRCIGFDVGFHELHILYTGFCHYDSLVGGVSVYSESEEVDLSGPRSILAEEMFNYNNKVVRLCQKSKKEKSSVTGVKRVLKKKDSKGVLQSSNIRVEEVGEVFLKDARIVRQPGDNCCLFHSLSYCLWDEGVVNYVHDEFSGFELRANIFSFLRDNGDVNVSLAPGVVTTISRALQLDGSSCEAYYQKMLNIAELGGPFEIAILAQMFSIGISIYECVPNTRYFRHLGSYRCIGFDVGFHELHILYTGFCHYDSLVGGVSVYSESEEVDLSGPRSILAEEMFNYNNKVVRLCQKSKKVKVVNSHVVLSDSTKLAKSQNLQESVTVSSRIRPFLMPLYNGSTECNVHDNRGARKVKRDLGRPNYQNDRPVRVSSSLCASDALLYSTSYDGGTRFIVCAICGYEGSMSGSKFLVDYKEVINSSGLKDEFLRLTSVHAYSTNYDLIFIDQLKQHFNDGLIKGCDRLCASCCYQLKGKRSSYNATSCQSPRGDVAEGSISHLSNGVNFGSVIPKLALFNGLFAGSIPVELIGLTSVEESMINIYSAITKMYPAGGKHYKLKGSTCYTIINDLTGVAKHLPRMPSIEDTAILRHKKATIGSDYTYRPFKVFTALNWLKKHNHLYADIDLVWPKDILFWQTTLSSVDIPFIEITDDDLNDICGDTEDVDEVMSDEFTTNTGMSFFCFAMLILIYVLTFC